MTSSADNVGRGSWRNCQCQNDGEFEDATHIGNLTDTKLRLNPLAPLCLQKREKSAPRAAMLRYYLLTG
jgi:hypothetical protein